VIVYNNENKEIKKDDEGQHKEGKNYLYLLFEHVTYDLKVFIDKNKIIKEEVVKTIMYQLLMGIYHLHSRKVLHRDLKPQNILIDPSSNVIKIADFGLSRTFSIPIKNYTSEILTLWYRSPELFLGIDMYSTQIDIWSIGCIFAELYLKKPLFYGEKDEISTIKRIFDIIGSPNESNWPQGKNLPKFEKIGVKVEGKNQLRDILPSMDEKGFDLLSKMLMLDPAKRISAKNALSHPYFDKVTVNKNIDYKKQFSRPSEENLKTTLFK